MFYGVPSALPRLNAGTYDIVVFSDDTPNFGPWVNDTIRNAIPFEIRYPEKTHAGGCRCNEGFEMVPSPSPSRNASVARGESNTC